MSKKSSRDVAVPGSVARLSLRATPAQRRVIRQAALSSGKSMNAYVLDSACAAAYQCLAERPDFLMDDPDWEHFLSLLGQPADEKDRLKALLAEPARPSPCGVE